MSNSLLLALLQAVPALRPQMYFKSALTALSHAIEDLVLVGKNPALVIANFQQERFYRQAVSRYRQIAKHTDQVYVLALPEAESGLAVASEPYEIVPLASSDGWTQEWHVIVVGQQYAACLVCREQATPAPASMDQARRFEGIWTFERSICIQAAHLLLERIAIDRPELAAKVEQAWQLYGLTTAVSDQARIPTSHICRRIIEGLGGQIWASSSGKNQGSEFHFTVPIEASDRNNLSSLTKGRE